MAGLEEVRLEIYSWNLMDRDEEYNRAGPPDQRRQQVIRGGCGGR